MADTISIQQRGGPDFVVRKPLAPARVDTRHRRGINVLYGDESAEWVERKVFDDEMKPCTSISATFNARQDAVWKLLDR